MTLSARLAMLWMMRGQQISHGQRKCTLTVQETEADLAFLVEIWAHSAMATGPAVKVRQWWLSGKVGVEVEVETEGRILIPAIVCEPAVCINRLPASHSRRALAANNDGTEQVYPVFVRAHQNRACLASLLALRQPHRQLTLSALFHSPGRLEARARYSR